MKYFVLALFVVAAVAAPTPQDENDVVELIVNGVPEGQPLEIGDVVDIKLKEHVNGQLASSSDLLHPLTAAGLAEAAAAAETEAIAEIETVAVDPVQIVEESSLEHVIPEVSPVVLPEPVLPEIEKEQLQSPVVLPVPAIPEVLEPLPAPIVMPQPAQPEIAPEVEVAPVPLPLEPEPLPQPAPQIPSGEIYNDGLVQVQVNAPQEEGVLSTLQSWLNVVINYFNNGVQTSNQIV